MKESPILFSTPMVKAILEGRKTQTRRAVKFSKKSHEAELQKATLLGGFIDFNLGSDFLPCPYGMPRDRLWVRETWVRIGDEYGYRATDSDIFSEVKWKPSIFMPRDASRILLEVTSVRVERLQDISEQDAIAEGVEETGENIYNMPIFKDYSGESLHGMGWSSAQRSFQSLWESINGADSWDLNPWVWVIEFKQIDK